MAACRGKMSVPSNRTSASAELPTMVIPSSIGNATHSENKGSCENNRWMKIVPCHLEGAARCNTSSLSRHCFSSAKLHRAKRQPLPLQGRSRGEPFQLTRCCSAVENSSVPNILGKVRRRSFRDGLPGDAVM